MLMKLTPGENVKLGFNRHIGNFYLSFNYTGLITKPQV